MTMFCSMPNVALLIGRILEIRFRQMTVDSQILIKIRADRGVRFHSELQALSDEVGTERSLLVVCSAFRGRKEGYPNLTVKKIPKAILSRCEWGHDDYSLQVENLPQAPPKPGQMEFL